MAHPNLRSFYGQLSTPELKHRLGLLLKDPQPVGKHPAVTVIAVIRAILSKRGVCLRCGALKQDHLDYGRPELGCPTTDLGVYTGGK
jgi:hypothetical protein